MPISKRILLPLAAVAVIGAAGTYGVSRASADSAHADPQSSLVQKLADTFKVDKSKVQAVFDEERASREKERSTRYEERLSQAVTDGKLTASQKTAVLAEHKKLAAQMEALKGKTDEERRAGMDKLRADAKAWSGQNNIDIKWLIGGGAMGHGGFVGHGGPGHRGGPGHDERSAHEASGDTSAK